MNPRFSVTKKSIMWMTKDTVVKIARISPHELELIHEHAEVFVPMSSYGDWFHVMPRWSPTNLKRALLDGARLLKDHLWSGVPLGRTGAWKNLLIEHLRHIYPSMKLIDRVDDLDAAMGTDRIHGDATLENLVIRDGIVKWIDPCWRPYVPADRRVDIAKMWQSCWNYEGVVHRNERPMFNQALAFEIAELAGMKTSDVTVIETWLCVHLARLLRYQTNRTRDLFEEVLRDHYTCGI